MERLQCVLFLVMPPERGDSYSSVESGDFACDARHFPVGMRARAIQRANVPDPSRFWAWLNRKLEENQAFYFFAAHRVEFLLQQWRWMLSRRSRTGPTIF